MIFDIIIAVISAVVASAIVLSALSGIESNDR